MADDEPTISDSELRYLAACARECRCCPQCSEFPCGGCTAGGVCDRICKCGDDDERDYWDERDEEDA